MRPSLATTGYEWRDDKRPTSIPDPCEVVAAGPVMCPLMAMFGDHGCGVGKGLVIAVTQQAWVWGGFEGGLGGC